MKMKAAIKLPRPRNKCGDGFTLLEMSIVLVIISVVLAGGMVMLSSSLQQRQLQETQAKLAAIQQALLDYRIANNRLPCPADVTIAIGNTNFGLEAGSVVSGTWTPTYGDCFSTGTVKANFQQLLQANGGVTNNTTTITYNATAGIAAGMPVTGSGIPNGDIVAGPPVAPAPTTTQLTLDNTGGATAAAATSSAGSLTFTFLDNVEGMVPTKTLRLPDDYAFDGWGRRIMYTVDARFTANNAFPTTNPLVDGSSNAPTPYAASRMTVNDASGKPKTYAAAYVLVSFGPDGFGAWPRGSGASNMNITTSRIDTLSTNADQKNNCDCKDSSGSIATTTFDGIFVQKMPTQNSAKPDHTDDFDDVVVYGTRADLRSPTE